MKRLLLAALVASMPATAQNLRMGVGAQITSADPHFHNISPNNAYASMVFDNLLETDSKARLTSSLAESWKPVGEDAWEFTLRRGVRFHNGSDFTAEDVAFTLERIPQVLNSPGSFRTYTQAITGAGPYRMMAYRSGDRVELQRFEGHWRGRPAWQNVDYRMITNDAGRTAALLAGDIDIIDQVPTSDIERLRRDQRIVLSEIDSMRFIYFALDHMRDGPTPFITDNDGKPFARNPLRDVRVRQALSLAIDRPAIVARVMEGAASATRQVMPEGAFGHVPELAVSRADPDQAKKLLAEAGYPNGFRLTLHGPNDRYPNDARIANRGRYSNPEFDTLIANAARELEPARREALLRQATRVVVEDAGIISTHLQKNIWAMRRGFAHVSRVDERTRAQDVTPAR